MTKSTFPSSDSMFWIPERVTEPDPWTGHIPFAFWVVEATEPRTLVELGTQTGNSYFAFCQAVDQLGLNATCFAVDTWKGDEHSGYYAEEIYEEVRAYHDERYGRFSRLVRSTFDDALGHFGDQSIDVLHIDGFHTYDAVAHDFKSWFPKVSDRGVVLLHDITVRERGFGVWRLWSELCTEFPFFSFCHSYGLGILAVGRSVPRKIERLCRAERHKATKARIQARFQRLGEAVSQNLALKRIRRTLTERQAELEAARADTLWQLSQRDRDITILADEFHAVQKERAEREQVVEALTAQVAEHDQVTASLRDQVADKEQTVEALTAQVAEHDQVTASLRDQVADKEQTVEALTAQVAEHDQAIADLRTEVANKAEALQALITQLAEHEQTVAALLVHLGERDARLEAIYASTSWRVTGPLRGAKRGWIALTRLPYFSRVLLGRTVRRVYLHLPLSYRQKQRLKSFIYRYFGFLIKNTVTYRCWLQSQGHFVTRAAASNRPPTACAPLDRDRVTDELDKIALPGESSDVLVSIVIPSYNHVDYTVRCLKSIQDNPSKSCAEVIVVDDCSQDESANVLRAVPGIRYIRNEQNLGFLRTCNRGASEARGKFLVFLNNDTEVLAGWLDELVETFNRVPNAGLVGSKFLYPDGRLAEAGGIIWNDGSAWNYGRYDDSAKPEYNYLREVDYVSAASIMVPKDLFQELGGFDERYAPIYCEDSDLAFKIRSVGLKVLYQPLSELIHHEGVTSGTDVTTGLKYHQAVNVGKFYQRWRGVLRSHGMPGEHPTIEKDRFITARALFIDPCTPTPDQDAGSVTVVHFLKIFQSFGYKVTFIPESNFLRMERYTTDLQRLGIECLYGPYVTSVEKHLKKSGWIYDVVILYRAPRAAMYIDSVRRYCPNAKVIFNTVDLHYLREQRMAELMNSTDLMRSAKQTEALELDVASKVDCTIVLSTYEKGILLESDPRPKVEVVPLILETHNSKASFHQRRDLCFIGGFQHLPNVDAVQYFLGEVWPLVKQKLPEIKFYVIGSNPPPEILGLTSQDVVVTGYVEDLGKYLQHCRVSVAPLRYGAGIKGKIGTSLSYGVPCVGTTISIEGMNLKCGEHVLVADDPRAFADAIVGLYSDVALWEKLSHCGLEFVRKEYSITAGRLRLARLVSEVGARPFYGTCNVCGRTGSFEVTSENLRESLICVNCESTSRDRMLAYALLKVIGDAKMKIIRDMVGQNLRVKILDTDNFSPISNLLRGCEFYWTSMYLPNRKFGTQIDKGVWNLDLMQMQFGDATFDIILTSDVLEHVRRDEPAFAEIWRCLKPGGAYIMTVPYIPGWAKTQVRVDTIGGEDVFLMEKEYHGDPLNPDGALVYRIFGRELYFELKKVGFDVTFENAPKPDLGIISCDLWICRKSQ